MVLDGSRALLFYAVYPGRPVGSTASPDQQRTAAYRASVIQVAELVVVDRGAKSLGPVLKCEREVGVGKRARRPQLPRTADVRAAEKVRCNHHSSMDNQLPIIVIFKSFLGGGAGIIPVFIVWIVKHQLILNPVVRGPIRDEAGSCCGQRKAR